MMSPPDPTDGERRVLVLAPTGRDAANSVALLGKAGLACVACRDIAALCREIAVGVGVVLLTEESLALDRTGRLAAKLDEQPAWSDLPVILLTRGGPESRVASRAMQTLGNVILLERPIRIFTLVSATRTAMRARNKQYQLRAQNRELRQADARKDEFLATLAHELRNPLAPVRTGLQVLERTAPGPIVERTRAMMERQVAHMVRLLDDLLDLSRISRGKIELRPERVELRAVVESALEICRPVIEAAHHDLSVELPAAPVWLHADPTRLAQVLGNILLNAAKYTAPGGRISLVGGVDGGEVVVAVTDNGEGISRELQDQVFEMFAQAPSVGDRAQSGLGIGLALVKQLIELHGGRVSVASPGPGRGSTFTLRLPIAGPVPVAAEESRAAAQAPAARLRVLVVDDNADAAEMLALALSLSGHETWVAGDGPGCLAVAAEFRPHVAFLDIGLPGMDGHELAGRLRDEPATRDIVLVALTGWGSEDDQRRSRAAGFAYHLTKPVTTAMVTELLAQIAVDADARPGGISSDNRP